MNMHIDLNEFDLPLTVEKDYEYLYDMKKNMNRYLEHLQNKLSESSEIVNRTKENILLLIQCINNYYNGKVVQAYTNIKQLLMKYVDGKKPNEFVVAPINANYAFRGCSPEELKPQVFSGKENDEMYSKMLSHELTFFRARIADETIAGKDMLHIPLNKRGIINSQRFSISGIPCIYLSTSSYGTWIEMGYPDPCRFQVSAIKIPTDIRVLNLCVQQHLIDGKISSIQNRKEEMQALACIEIFPLVIATSYKVLESDRAFKSEYIISQIVMQVCSDIGIGGVAYLSKRTWDSYAYPYAVNLAIAIPNNTDFLYWKRSNEVSITEPVRFVNFLEKGIRNKGKDMNYLSYVNDIFKDNDHNSILVDNMKIEYITTDFSAFDEYILGKEFVSFPINTKYFN